MLFRQYGKFCISFYRYKSDNDNYYAKIYCVLDRNINLIIEIYIYIVLKTYLILELKAQFHLYNFICELACFYQLSCECEKNVKK